MLVLATGWNEWDLAKDLIADACRRGPGDLTANELRDDCAKGFKQLWVSIENGAVVCAAVTAILNMNDGSKVCEWTAVGGRDWRGHEAAIIEWAKSKGCARMRLIGRKGWIRALPEYRVAGVILEKELRA